MFFFEILKYEMDKFFFLGIYIRKRIMVVFLLIILFLFMNFIVIEIYVLLR